MWKGHVFSADGFGEEARSFVKAFYAFGLPVVVVSDDDRYLVYIL